MSIVLVLLQLTGITLLSRPGLIRKLPFDASPLSNVQNLVFQRALAVVLMAPVIIIEAVHMPDWMSLTPSAVGIVVPTLILVPLLAYFIASADKSDLHRAMYRGLQDRKARWFVYLIVTCTYMLSYEVILRGTVLDYLLTEFDVVYAIAINVTLYAAMHLAKNIREALLCIPLGTLLCWMTIRTNSVWPAACFHTIMALSFEFYYSRKGKHVISTEG